MRYLVAILLLLPLVGLGSPEGRHRQLRYVRMDKASIGRLRGSDGDKLIFDLADGADIDLSDSPTPGLMGSWYHLGDSGWEKCQGFSMPIMNYIRRLDERPAGCLEKLQWALRATEREFEDVPDENGMYEFTVEGTGGCYGFLLTPEQMAQVYDNEKRRWHEDRAKYVREVLKECGQ